MVKMWIYQSDLRSLYFFFNVFFIFEKATEIGINNHLNKHQIETYMVWTEYGKQTYLFWHPRSSDLSFNQ